MSNNTMTILGTSLNLRIEPGKTIDDYKHIPTVGKIQNGFSTDIIWNGEDMLCDDAGYSKALPNYNPIFGMEDRQKRGISVYVKSGLKAEKVMVMTKPHLMHVKVYKDSDYINLIVFRILVSDSSQNDFIDRRKQFESVIKYTRNLEDKHNIVLTGDWNHGVINDNGIDKRDCGRHFFNYQYIEKELLKNGVIVKEMKGFSYKGYMKIDHIAADKNVKIVNAQYVDPFKSLPVGIGVPDHKSILAEVEFGAKKGEVV